MKNWPDVQKRFRQELERWVVEQIRKPYAQFHLYYRPTTDNHDGDIVISEETPGPGYQLATAQRIMHHRSTQQNMNEFCDVLRRLPVLAKERP